MHDVAAESLADALVTEAHAQQRYLAGETLDERHGYAGFVRGARPRRDDDAIRAKRRNLVEADLVVATDDDLLPKLAEILDEVVGKRIVVVDHEQHGYT